MDFIGVTRTIDRAVYMALNAVAIILWRLDAAIIGISMLGYNTQDWLTGSEGGVWQVMNLVTGPSGILGVATWQAFLILAVMLFGLSRVMRPLLNVQPVHPMRLLIFGVMSYVIITQGAELMRAVEAWRSEAGSYMYNAASTSGGASIQVPGSTPSEEPLYAPSDLDGNPPLRGWEAVASSYFLVQNATELHAGVPPPDFRVAYCLYDPGQPIPEQAEENAAGCSPRLAWDEWDIVEVDLLADVFGIELNNLGDVLTGLVGFILGLDPEETELTTPVEIVQEHPENRQLAIRQAQSGVARLALGPIVALFPLIEANISLMLALAASFLYLSLPIVLIFGFFLATESIVNRLLLQLINVLIRTLIINGLMALFLMLLMSMAASGSLMSYLGLVGVGLVGGFILSRYAAATMKESLTMSLSAVGGIFTGVTSATLGNAAAKPARAVLGAAKLGATAAVMGVAGWRNLDLAEASLSSARSGVRDLNRASPETMEQVRRASGQLPAPLARLAQSELSPPRDGSEPETIQAVVPPPGATEAPPPEQAEAGSANGRQVAQAGLLAGLPLKPRARDGQADLTTWVEQAYRTRERGRGQQQVREAGRDLLGEELTRSTEAVMTRRSHAETLAAIKAGQQVAAQVPPGQLIRAGRVTPAGLDLVRARLDAQTVRAFADEQGRRDLATLLAAGWQVQQRIEPEQFQRVMATVPPGQGRQAPGRVVPQRLGLDPVAAGPHYSRLNRFARLSEAAGLSGPQKQRLIAEARQDQISAELRQTIEQSIQQQKTKGQARGLAVDEVVASARALPETLSGPKRVQTAGQLAQPPDERLSSRPATEARPPAQGQSQKRDQAETATPAQPTATKPTPVRPVRGRVEPLGQPQNKLKGDRATEAGGLPGHPAPEPKPSPAGPGPQVHLTQGRVEQAGPPQMKSPPKQPKPDKETDDDEQS